MHDQIDLNEEELYGKEYVGGSLKPVGDAG
jgi:hypothetical protein